MTNDNDTKNEVNIRKIKEEYFLSDNLSYS